MAAARNLNSFKFPARGLALVAVLWITAALGLVAMTLSNMARTDVRVTQMAQNRVQADALTRGGLALACEWLGARIVGMNAIQILPVRVAGTAVQVRIVPASGLINLNQASVDLLTALFERGAGLSRGQSLDLADQVVVWRTPVPPSGRRSEIDAEYRQVGMPPPRFGPFRVPADLRQVRGVTPEIYARIAPLVMVNPRVPNDRVDPRAAPLGVLRVLSGADDSLVQRIFAARQAGEDPSTIYQALPSVWVGNQGSFYYRLTARVQVGGDEWQQTWWVDYSQQTPGGIPWQVTQQDPLVIATNKW